MKVSALMIVWCQASDMDRSVAFYRDVLGLSLEFSSPHWSQFRIGSMRLGLHPSLSGKTPPHGEYGSGWFVGLEVDDLKALRGRLEAVGAPVHGDYHEVPGGTVLDFADPDGNVIEAMQIGVKAADLG
jgi:predicted enzyme related to lactoylglutathione lyase